MVTENENNNVVTENVHPNENVIAIIQFIVCLNIFFLQKKSIKINLQIKLCTILTV